MTINLLCAGNNVFVNIKLNGFNPKTPLAHALAEYKLSALQASISEENKINAMTQQFITAKVSGCALKQGSKTHPSLRPSNVQLQNETALMSCRIRAVEHRKCVAGPAGAHLGLQDRILLNYTRMENVHEVRKKTFNFLLCIEAEPSSESGQKEGFTFVRGALRSCKGAWHSNLTKIPLICSVSYFNLGGIGALSGGAKPTKTTRGDGTV